MINVYCDNGAFRKELKVISADGRINLIMFPYENKNRNIKNMGMPSETTWNDLGNVSWVNAPGRWSDYTGSNKYQKIQRVIGKQHQQDVKHLDAAYKSKCQCFLTRDKGDIYSKKVELENLLGMKIYHTDDDWQSFLEYIKQ